MGRTGRHGTSAAGSRRGPALPCRHVWLRAASAAALPPASSSPSFSLSDVVIAPETVHKEPGLGWLALERLPRLSMEASLHLERVIDGLRIGCWPFCAPLARWNEAAEIYPCLAIAVDDEQRRGGARTSNVRSSDLRLPRQVDRWTRGATGLKPGQT